MMNAVFDLPIWIVGTALVLVLTGLSLAGLFCARRFLLPRLRLTAEDSGFAGAILSAVTVFYGLIVALVAVSVWERYSAVSGIVSNESVSIAALWRDLASYPEPIRGKLQDELRGYTDYVIREAWPLQKKGEVPRGGVDRVNRLQTLLYSFEPVSDPQKILHAECLHAYNQFLRDRRLRLDAVGGGLPGVMWTVILLGAGICMIVSYFFRVQDVRVHAILVTLLGIFVGLVILLVIELDRPFRGDLAISPESYELIYDQLMKR